jgi:hypothetical protein
VSRSAILHRLAGVAWVMGIAIAVGLLLGTGGMVERQPKLAVVVAVGILAVGLTLVEAATIPLLVIPALLVINRVHAGGIDLSFSDFALFVAFWPAVFLGKRPYSRPMRTMIWLSVIYQVSTMFTLVLNPYKANVVEWFHAGLLVAGALIVGWTVGRAGYARLGMNALVLAAAVLAVLAVGQALIAYSRGDFSPLYVHWPYPMHKNFVGTILGCIAVVLYARPPFIRWRRGTSLALFWLCVAGILVSQSRQALIGLGIALVFIVLRRESHVRRSRLIMLAVAPLLGLIGMSVNEQVKSGNEFNSLFQRLSWFQDSVDVWSRSPYFGVGLRWWYTDRFKVRFQPPNAEMEVLTSAGIVGLLGFLILMVGAIVVLWRLDPAFGTAAAAAVMSRMVQAQMDLFWVAAQASLPFLIAGIALGAHALEHQSDELLERLAQSERASVPA